MVKLEDMDLPALQDQQDLVAKVDLVEDLESQVPVVDLDQQDLLDPEDHLDHQDQLALMDLQEEKDHLDLLVH